MATHTTAEDKKWLQTSETVAFFKNIDEGILAVGLTKTEDTGQIDLTTAPTVVMNTPNHIYGYSIFQFTDTYQTTYPIYLKITYMNDAGSHSTRQRVIAKVDIGEGTDGSGNLTGKTDTRFFTSTSTTTSNTDTFSTNNICFAKGTLIITTGVTATSGTVGGVAHRLTAVGRRADMSGNYTNGFYKVQMLATSVNAQLSTNVEESHIVPNRTQNGVLAHNSVNASNTSILRPYHWTAENTSLSYDNSIPVFPLYTLTPNPEYIPGVIATIEGVGYNNTLTADLNGSTTYITTNANPINNNTMRLAHIWE